MNTIEEITTIQDDQKWMQPFNDLLNEIYYPGYAENLGVENPKAYQTEYFYFLAMYL